MNVGYIPGCFMHDLTRFDALRNLILCNAVTTSSKVARNRSPKVEKVISQKTANPVSFHHRPRHDPELLCNYLFFRYRVRTPSRKKGLACRKRVLVVGLFFSYDADFFSLLLFFFIFFSQKEQWIDE